VIFEKLFSCVCLPLEKLVNEKHFPVNKKYFPVKEKFCLVSRKVLSFILEGKHFPEVVKNLKISYYLPIISNLVLKLLIAIYIYCFEYLFFNFIICNLIFILTLILIFILLFPYYFLIKMFYLSNLVLIFLIVTYFIWNNLWNVNYYYFNFLFNLYYFDYYLFYLR